jgi:hypothetical protein
MIGLCLTTAFSRNVLAQEPVSAASWQVVSLSKIRAGLAAQPSSLRLIPPEPTFRIIVWETQHLYQVLEQLQLRDAHTPPGGLYAFGQRQQLGNPWIGQPLVKIDVLPQVEAIGQAIAARRRASAEEAAREEVSHALVEMCLANVCQSADR